MSYSLVNKKKAAADNKSAGGKSQGNAKHIPKKGQENNAKVEALSTLTVKEGKTEALSYSLTDQKNHTGKNFTSEEDKQYTIFVKEINADAVTVSVKGPGVFESKSLSRSPAGSPAGTALASPQTILGFEFVLSGPALVKKATGMM